MSFKIITDSIRDAANAVKGTGKFISGRIVDASQISITTDFPLIVLYPFQEFDPTSNEVAGRTSVMMGFYMQDKPDSEWSEDQSIGYRESLINSMDILSRQFINSLNTKYKKHSIVGAFREPQFQQYSGTLSGIALKFTYLTVTPC